MNSSSSSKAILSVEGLGIQVGGKWLLRDINFSLHPGEAITLVGESGAGKSLLAQAIMGNLPPSLKATGQITLDSKTTRAEDSSGRRALWGRKLALLPQEPSLALDPLARIRSQLAEVYQLLHRQPADAAKAHAYKDLKNAGLGSANNHYPWQLSGGMAQRTTAAITLAGGASVLMLDEPTKGLDKHWRDHMVAVFLDVLKAGACLLTITHDMQVAQAIGGKVIVLQQGKIVEHGDVYAISTKPTHPFTKRLIQANPALWKPWKAQPAGDVVLQAKGISKVFGEHTLFRSLDVSIRNCERISLQGPSGSGKSTLGNVLLGLIQPDSGSVQRNPLLKPHALQKIYQNPVGSFAPQIPIKESLMDAVRLHKCDWVVVQRRLDALRVAQDLLVRRPDQVSGGELQRIALARVLIAQPKLLFADEPTSRLDPITQQDAMQVLQEAMNETGAALLLSTHDSHIAAAVGTRSLRWDNNFLDS